MVLLSLLSSLCILLGFASIFFSNRSLIKANAELREHLTDIVRLNIIVDLLQTQCHSPIIYEFCEQIRRMNFEELPRNQKEFIAVCRKSMKIFQEKTWKHLQESFEKAESPEEKDFFKKRIDKFSDVMNLFDSIDENSSMDFVKLIAEEIQKALIHDLDDMKGNDYE